MRLSLEQREGPMNIHVNRIPPEGLKSRATYDPATMDMDRPDVHPRAPFHVDVSMAMADQELVVNVEIRCPLRLVCARCLEEFDSTVATDALFSYPVEPTDVVDITDDVRQEIILAYPMIPLCRPDCKGLCSACGANLNVTSCNHRAIQRPGHDEWPRGSMAL